MGPSRELYREISSFNNLDLIIAAGFIPNYESESSDTNDPFFAKYWSFWATAAYGHIYRYYLSGDQQECAINRYLSNKGKKYWQNVRKYLIDAFDEFFKVCFPDKDVQIILRNNEDE